MAIVIGAGTIVSFAGCVISANWSSNTNSERLYCLGVSTPYLIISRPTQSLSLTIYAPGPSYSLDVTETCNNANTIAASVSPAGCGGSAPGVGGSWFVTQYSYSKEDPALPGQESWSLTQWIGGGILPNYVLRGISEGEGTANSGIVFGPGTVLAYNGSVSANSIGRADTVSQGIVLSVGGGEGSGGSTGTGSVSVPYTPLYLGT